MDQPPPGDDPPEGGATKHSKIFLAAMGAIIVPIVVLVGFMLSRRPDPGMIEVSCSRVADNDALLILTTWSEREGDDAKKYFFARLKMADETVPPKMVFGMRAPNKQEQVFFVVPSRFDVANFTHDARVNFRTLRYYCGKLLLRLNSAQERYNMIQPDGTVVPISAGMLDLVEKVIAANPRVFSLDGVSPPQDLPKKTEAEVAADEKRELELLRQLVAIDPAPNDPNK